MPCHVSWLLFGKGALVSFPLFMSLVCEILSQYGYILRLQIVILCDIAAFGGLLFSSDRLDVLEEEALPRE